MIDGGGLRSSSMREAYVQRLLQVDDDDVYDKTLSWMVGFVFHNSFYLKPLLACSLNNGMPDIGMCIHQKAMPVNFTGFDFIACNVKGLWRRGGARGMLKSCLNACHSYLAYYFSKPVK